MSLTTVRSPAPRAAAGAAPGAAQEAKLHKVAEQMAGTFAEQLFKAMRETVPQGEGAFDGGSGEEMFSGLMDQHLAAETPTQWARGLTDSIVRHLRGALEAQQGGATPDRKPATLRPLHEAAALDPLHPPAQLQPLQQSPQLQPLPDVTR
jgi:flagellar protein FlgJ